MSLFSVRPFRLVCLGHCGMREMELMIGTIVSSRTTDFKYRDESDMTRKCEDDHLFSLRYSLEFGGHALNHLSLLIRRNLQVHACILILILILLVLHNDSSGIFPFPFPNPRRAKRTVCRPRIPVFPMYQVVRPRLPTKQPSSQTPKAPINNRYYSSRYTHSQANHVSMLELFPSTL